MSASPRRRWPFRLLALALGGLTALALTEAGLWIFAPVPHPYAAALPQVGANVGVYPGRWKQMPGRVLRVPDGLPGTSGGEIRINRLGFRGDEITAPRPDELRLLALGGSTTFCAAQADGKDWPALVRARLGAGGRAVRLLNAGYPGQRLRGHMIACTQLTPAARPQLVIVLAGINDAVYGLDPERNPQLRLGAAEPPYGPRLGTSLKLLLADSQLVRRLMFHRGLELQEGVGAAARATAALPLETKAPHVDVAEYRTELTLLCRYLVGLGARPVLVTQPALYLSSLPDAEVDARCWMNRVGQRRWPRAVLRRALEAHNAVTREVAAAERAVLVDAAAELDDDPQELLDDCHFTDRGCVELAALVADAIEAALKRR